MRRVRYVVGMAVGLVAGAGVGFAAGNLLLGVFLASIVTLASFYMIWEANSLGADAADLPRHESSGEAATHADVTADIDAGGGAFGG